MDQFPNLQRFGNMFAASIEPCDAFTALFEAVPIGVTLLTLDSRIVEVNAHVCNASGYSREELIGRSVYDITHAEDIERQRSLTSQLISGEVDRFRMEKRVVRADGSEMWTAITLARFHIDGVDGSYLLSMSEDITDRKLAEQRLRESEERFRILINGVKEYALFLTDVNGIVTTWNPGVLRVLGWDESEIVGQHISVIYTPEDREAGVPQQEMNTALREGAASDERWHVKKDGSRFYAIGVMHPYVDAYGNHRGFSKVFGDFTARYKAEEWLQRQAALLDLSLDAIFVQEPVANRIVYWSRGAERTYGWTRAEAEGKVAYELLQTEFPVRRELILTALKTAGCWEGDLTHTCKDGRRIIVASRWALEEDADSRGIRSVLEVNRDVTDRRRMEAEHLAFASNQKRIADALQRSLLMAPPPEIHPGLTVKALYQAAQEDVLVGGDFFDIFAVAKDQVGIVIGDATGKGLEAATYTAEVKFILRAYLREFASPAAALTRLNSFVFDKDQLDSMHFGQSYMAIAAVVINTSTGNIAVATAGAEPPMLLKVSGENVAYHQGGPLLGVAQNAEYEDSGGVIEEGDVLMLSTDGLIEARNPHRRREYFGGERLAEAVRKHDRGSDSLAQVSTAVLEDARVFSGGLIRDDVCLILVKRTPVARR